MKGVKTEMSATHIHVIDGKQLSYSNDTCPICKPDAPEPQAPFVPRAYRKALTIIVQVSKGIMSTTTWWAKGECFLHSVRKVQRDAQNVVMRDNKGMPLWLQVTMRLNTSLAKEYVTELMKLIKEVENVPEPTPSNVPQRM